MQLTRHDQVPNTTTAITQDTPSAKGPKTETSRSGTNSATKTTPHHYWLLAAHDDDNNNSNALQIDNAWPSRQNQIPRIQFRPKNAYDPLIFVSGDARFAKEKKARSKATRQRKKRVAQNMQIGRLTFYVILMGLFKHTRLLVLSRKYLKKNRCKETALHIYSDILMKQNLQQPRLRRNTFVIRIARFLVLLNFWAPEAHRA